MLIFYKRPANKTIIVAVWLYHHVKYLLPSRTTDRKSLKTDRYNFSLS